MEETGNIEKTLEKQLHAGLGGASFILTLAIGVLTAGIFLLTGHVSLVLEEQGKENEVLSAVMGLMLLFPRYCRWDWELAGFCKRTGGRFLRFSASRWPPSSFCSARLCCWSGCC